MDILGRFHRLCGERVLLLPGKDHAGIQTQVVFEKRLRAEKVDIKELGIDALYKQCYDFCIDRSNYMRAQEKRIGISADWSRELFTLDPRLNSIIFETFERMWRDGLVYRGTRIINWSVFSQTAISDVEVEYKEVEGGLWYLCYQLVSPKPSSHELTLPSGSKVTIGQPGLFSATTRPETMLGDTALAVHPSDERYKDYIGCEVIVPLVGRRIKVVADRRVDPAYGTGVIKVTPAHDFVDAEIGLEHKLEAIQVIGKDGKMTAAAGPEFVGMTTLACRDAVVQRLTDQNLLFDTAAITHKVPIGERGKDIIEPLLSEQWFVNVDKPGNSLKGRALELIKSGKINVHPERFRGMFVQWLENLHDWNISRQIWWGHRMPVWYRGSQESPEIFVGQAAPQGDGWRQETDTFDTWFSSGQWAFSTIAAQGLGSLDGKAKSDFFPNNTMVMGRDILLFWACRMLLLTTYRLGEVPWRNIFFTGLIRDEHGQKMSKSKGNGIEPNAIIDRYGADALRLGLVMGASSGMDMSLSERKIEGYSKFINKLWNAAKLVEMKISPEILAAGGAVSSSCATVAWMLAGLSKTQQLTTKHLREFEISMAADELYSFTWQVYCDWYLEMMKVLIEHGSEAQRAEVASATISSLRSILTMLHSFIPFVTEEIYQKLPIVQKGPILAVETWPNAESVSATASPIPLVMEIVTAVRSIKAALAIPHKNIRVSMDLKLGSESILLFTNLARVTLVAEVEIPEAKALRKPFSQGVIICEVDDREAYRKRLEKDLASNQAIVANIEAKLAGAFAKSAKPELVEQERARLLTSQHLARELANELQQFS